MYSLSDLKVLWAEMSWAEKGISILIAAILLGCISMAALSPYFEARTFNKFSEKKATYWDAVFADLRVQAK